MAVLHFILFAALLAVGYSGATHVEELSILVKHHADIMAKEISQRLNEGIKRSIKRSIAVHRNMKITEVGPSLEPTAVPTFPPTISTTFAPTKSPTSGPTVSPNASPPTSPAPTVDRTPSPTVAPSLQRTLPPNLSSTGFFYLTNSFKSDCSSPAVSYGVPVDTCFADNSDGYAYVIRIVNGNFFLHLRPRVLIPS